MTLKTIRGACFDQVILMCCPSPHLADVLGLGIVIKNFSGGMWPVLLHIITETPTVLLSCALPYCKVCSFDCTTRLTIETVQGAYTQCMCMACTTNVYTMHVRGISGQREVADDVTTSHRLFCSGSLF